jgi:cell division protease FtsH
MALGGRAAEQVVFGKISTGALSDLEKITKMAYSMVTIYGLNDKIGNLSFYDSKGQSEYNFTKPYSDDTARTIDEEVKKLVDEAYVRTIGMLNDKRELLNSLAEALLKREVLYQNDLVEIIGERPFEVPTAFQEFMDREDTVEEVAEVIEEKSEDSSDKDEDKSGDETKA